MSATLTPDEPELRPVGDAAEFLHVSPRMVYRLLRQGELSGYRVGRYVRIDMREVRAMITPVDPKTIGIRL